MVSRIVPRLSVILKVEHGAMVMTVGKVQVREIPVRKVWIANFRFFFYEIYVQNQWGFKIQVGFEIQVDDCGTGGPSSITVS